MDPWDFRQQVMLGGGNAPILGPFDPATGQQSAVAISPEDFRQQVSLGGGYAPILGNFDPTRQQATASIPSTSSTFSSSYPTTTAAPAASAATSYRYSPRTSTGRRNRYAEIMSQYEQAKPYSFTSMPSSYTGGYDNTPYQPYVAPTNRYADIIAQGATAGERGGRNGQEPPSAWSQLSPAEQAAYYKLHPIEGGLALAGQDALGWTTFGAISKYGKADNWYNSRLIKQGYDPEQFAYGPPDPNFSSQAAAAARQEAQIAAVNAANEAGAGFVANPMSSDPQQAAAAAQAAQAAAAAQSSEGGPGYTGGGEGGSYSEAPSGGSDVERSAPDSAHYSQGGHVSMMHLQGPNPVGPDDGYGALKDGEYVINDKAVKKYGIKLMNAINSGKISKGKLRGLLEM